MTSCAVHYDIIYHPFPINSQYLKMSGVDSPHSGHTSGQIEQEKNGQSLDSTD